MLFYMYMNDLYHNNPKYWDREPEQMVQNVASDQDLHSSSSS